MTDSNRNILKKLRRLERLARGAATEGERNAAEAARRRLVESLKRNGVHVAPELVAEVGAASEEKGKDEVLVDTSSGAPDVDWGAASSEGVSRKAATVAGFDDPRDVAPTRIGPAAEPRRPTPRVGDPVPSSPAVEFQEADWIDVDELPEEDPDDPTVEIPDVWTEQDVIEALEAAILAEDAGAAARNESPFGTLDFGTSSSQEADLLSPAIQDAFSSSFPDGTERGEGDDDTVEMEEPVALEGVGLTEHGRRFLESFPPPAAGVGHGPPAGFGHGPAPYETPSPYSQQPGPFDRAPPRTPSGMPPAGPTPPYGMPAAGEPAAQSGFHRPPAMDPAAMSSQANPAQGGMYALVPAKSKGGLLSSGNSLLDWTLRIATVAVCVFLAFEVYMYVMSDGQGTRTKAAIDDRVNVCLEGQADACAGVGAAIAEHAQGSGWAPPQEMSSCADGDPLACARLGRRFSAESRVRESEGSVNAGVIFKDVACAIGAAICYD